MAHTTGAAPTPGPWQMWTSCSFRRISSERGGDGDVLCAVVQHSDGHPGLHFKNGGFDGPDARLILAALIKCEKRLSMVAGMVHDERMALIAARTAISKATGAAP